MKTKNIPIPKEPKIWIYSIFLGLCDPPIVKQIVLVIRTMFIDLSPEIPVSLAVPVSKNTGKKSAIYGFIVTFFFLLYCQRYWSIF